MKTLHPTLHRSLRHSIPVLTLASLALPVAMAMAQTSNAPFQPQVMHRFTGSGNPNTLGGKPMVPPALGLDDRLYGHTFTGGPTLSWVLGQGTAYSLDALTGAGYRSVLLGDISTAVTPLVRDAAGKFYAGSSNSNQNHNVDLEPFGSKPAMVQLNAGMPVLLAQPTFRPRGSMAIDDAGQLYVGEGVADATCNASATQNILWRMNTDQTYSKVVDFCQYAQPQGKTELHPLGGAPVASVWSPKDKALYVLTTVSTTGVFNSALSSDNHGRSVGTLVKIDQAAIDAGVAAKGVLAADKIQLLHTFMQGRDGEPMAQGARIVGMIEAGDWIYGTAQSNGTSTNTTINGGTLWRVKKSDPSSFKVLHYFRAAPIDQAGKEVIDGSMPSGPLVLAADGNIYGTTARDGTTINTPKTGAATAVGAGVLYRIKVGTQADRADDSYEVLRHFDLGTEGGTLAGLSLGATKAGVQKLYGAASSGGSGEKVVSTVLDNPGNGTVFSIDIPLPTASFTTPLAAGATSVVAGSNVNLSWATSNAATCTASGAWNGAQQTSASNLPVLVSQTGENVFTLSCASNNDGPAITSSVTVTATASPGTGGTDNGSGNTGGGGGGPLSALLFAPLAAAALLRKRLKPSP